MTKNLTLPLLLLLAHCATAQIIPGATRQPQWAMPFYFEDANGDKDTIWVGYDPNAIYETGGFDKEFNEWQEVDSNVFTAAVCPNSISPILHTKQPKESAYKADVQSRVTPSILIGFRNGQMPVTLYSDNSHFYSESLPFADITPRPRGRGDMDCINYEPPYQYCHTGTPGYSFVLTDQPRPYFPKVFQDSFFFDGSGNFPPGNAINLRITIMPYDAYFQGLEEKQDSEIRIFPNPFSNKTQINLPPHSDNRGYLIIQDLRGKVVWQMKADNPDEIIIETSHWSRGIYILQYITNCSTLTYKLIKE